MIELLRPEDAIAMQHVKRWHMVRVNRIQSIAEHSHTVAMLAVWLNELLGSPHKRAEVIEVALIHDAYEIEYGDTPGVTKKYLDRKAGEYLAESTFWRKRAGEDRPSPSLGVRSVVDLADRLEAWAFYLLEGTDDRIKSALWESFWTRFYDDWPLEARTKVWEFANRVILRNFTPQPGEDWK